MLVNSNLRRSILALTLVTSLLCAALVSLGQEPLKASAAVQESVPKLAHSAPVSPLTQWQPVSGFQAVFQDEQGQPSPLGKEHTYWTTDNLDSRVSGNISASMVGQLYPIFMKNTFEHNSGNSQPTSQSLSATMYLKPTKVTPSASNAFSSTYIFTSQAIGTFGGEARNPNGTLSLYTWSWAGGSTVGGLNCSAISNAKNGLYTPVVRFDDYPAGQDPHDTSNTGANIFWTCMPTPGGYDGAGGGRFGFPATGDTQATGGEMDQVTGLLYVNGTTSGNIINVGGNTVRQNDGGIAYSIWDPTNGSFSLSGPVQANDWEKGMTTPPQDQLSATIYNQEHQSAACRADAVFEAAKRSYDSKCTYSNGLQASPDMGLDASGNFYVYAGTTGTYTNAGTTELLKIAPNTTYSGQQKTITDGSPENPWRYSMLTKTSHGQTFAPSGYGAPPNYVVGMGIHNGNLLFTGYYPLSGTFTPADGSAFTSPTNATKYPVRVNPLNGVMNILTTSNNPAIATPYGSTTIQNPLADSGGNRDSASAQELIVVKGKVYEDAQAKADYSSFSEEGLMGMTMNLYDSAGTLIGATQTSADGSYSFILPSYGRYYVRLVQPRIHDTNAFQTWGSVVGGSGADPTGASNTPTVVCASGDITLPSSEQGKPCQGALPFPYVDPNPPLDANGDLQTGHVDPAWNGGNPQWGTYAKVDVGTYFENPQVNFAISTGSASWGDASGSTPASAGHPANVGPFRTTRQQAGPYFQNPYQLTNIFKKFSNLHLGKHLGTYADGRPDPGANSQEADPTIGLSHAQTDDGIQVLMPADQAQDVSSYCAPNPTYADTALVPLQDAALLSGYTYCLKAQVSGSLAGEDAAKAAPSLVLGWQSPSAPGRLGGWTSVQSQLAYAAYAGNQADGSGDPAETYSTLTVPALPTGKARPVQARFALMTNSMWANNGGDPAQLLSSTVPADNSTHAYDGPKPLSSAADREYFVQPGEVEDYQYQNVGLSMRIVAKMSQQESVGPLAQPVEVKYNTDASDEAPSTSSDSLKLDGSSTAFTLSPHLPKLDVTDPTSSLTFTTGLPKAKAGRQERASMMTVSKQHPVTCEGSYVGQSGAIHPYQLSLKALPNDSSVAQPADQTSADTSNVSYQVSTYFQPTVDLPAKSGLAVSCTVTYGLEGQVGELPATGAMPWGPVSALLLLAFGLTSGAVYTVRWAHERGGGESQGAESASGR
ncbi:hypothetical protein KIM372_14740 [Bombiscardovia nodaiensis]|uniref:Uncharacterized protein n=1 Tax=Bombiscardovia nodaiensis TaxID=2932181 RepID=A0ABM8B9J9_9BIFI|nr:hypothetical protein KIM372_14740 [Bombiscardovia nodaiensis]